MMSIANSDQVNNVTQDFALSLDSGLFKEFNK